MLKLKIIMSTLMNKVSNNTPLLAGCLLAAVMLMPQNLLAQDDSVDEVVVSGIQQSLQAANDLKRNETRIVDAVVAEDIGKLPDNNIAEALQRITGVSIETDFGIGDSVSIRGLPQNRVELNGRTTTGDDRDGISLQDFPSSFLRSVEVVKSPTADMIEGALGGTVRMNTIRPLDLTELTIAGTLDWEQADKTDEAAPIGNIVGGNVWELDDGSTLGVIGMYSFQDRTLRQDEFFNRVRLYGVGDDNKFSTGADGTTFNDITSGTPTGRFAIRDQNTVEQDVEERERTAINLTLQWQPASQQGQFYLDYTTTDRKGHQSGNSILDVGGTPTYDASTTYSGGYVNNYTLPGAFVIPKTWSEFRETESESIAFGGEWDFADNIVVSGEISIVSSESKQPDSELNLRPISRTDHAAWVNTCLATDATARSAAYVTSYNAETDILNADDDDENDRNRIQSVAGSVSSWNEGKCEFQIEEIDANVAIVAGSQDTISRGFNDDRSAYNLRHTTTATVRQAGDSVPSVIYEDGNVLTAAENLAVRDFFHDLNTTKNDETAYRLDVDFTDGLEIPFVTSLQAGFRTTTNEYEYNLSRYQAKDLYRNAYNTTTQQPFVRWIDDYATAFPGSIETFNHSNSFSQTGLSGQLDLLTYRIYSGDRLANANQTFNEIQTLFAGTNYDVGGTLASNLEVQEGSYRKIDENTQALYATVDMDFENGITAVIGARFVQTEIDSTSIVDGKNQMRSHDYDDLLPSVNVAYELDADSKIRFAYANVMRRPDFEDLSSAFVIDNSVVTATQGAFDLDPYRATQFDVSYERYFEEGGIFSFAVYTKDVDSFLTSTTTCVASGLTAAQNVTEYENVCLLQSRGVSTDRLVFSNVEQDVIDAQAAGLTGIRTSSATNGEDGTVEGFEIGYQKQFTNLPGFWSGLGVNANYTYADSEQPNGNPLLDISENTYNIQGYWEKDGIAVRLAYNYRDEYLDTEEEKRG